MIARLIAFCEEAIEDGNYDYLHAVC